MLPIEAFFPQIKQSLALNNNLVLQAEPGAGKSTALPLALLNEAWLKNRKIIMLEPRRVAVKTIAHYLAKQLGETVGQRIGYHIKNDKKTSKDTVIEIVTEGILTRRLQNDPELGDIALILFDEFHERSVHADISLMLALDVQNTIREDLKLMVMSATIDTDFIANYMGGAEVIKCPGRVFPVSVNYLGFSKNSIKDQVVSALKPLLLSDKSGDILVFLSGQSDIKQCINESEETFADYTNVIFLPLYGSLNIQQQEKVLVTNSDGKRRVIFATNIAETSLTIEGVTCVIDSGLEKTLVYDSSSAMTRLETSYISKASAEQRKGRAGRTQAGTCYRLWDEAKHSKLNDYQSEEILSADLTSTVLELFKWGETSYEAIHWLTAPPVHHYNAAISDLVDLKLIDRANKITPLGVKSLSLAIPPNLAAMVLTTQNASEKAMACELAALISERDIFSQNNGSDIVQRLVAIQDYKTDKFKALKHYPINKSSLEQLLNNARSLKRSVQCFNSNEVYTHSQLQQSVAKLLLAAYPSRLAKKRGNSHSRYQMANGKGVYLFDDDPLFGCDWLVIADCDGQKTEGRIFSAAEITQDCLQNASDVEFSVTEEYRFDKKLQKITGRKVSRYKAIEISSSIINKIPKEHFQNCLNQVLKQDGFSILNWTKQCEQWLARAEWLGHHLDAFPTLSKESLMQNMDRWLLPYLHNVKSLEELKNMDIYNLLLSILSWDEQKLLEKEAPIHYTTPSNKHIPIHYGSQQGPIVSVVLQEVFGEVETPLIAEGKAAIRFELLSPAKRPIQTTSDLAIFWQTSYFDVAKDMKGRYPKHRWPEHPLLEKAGKSYKYR